MISAIIRPGTAVDTTGDPAWAPLRVVAELADPVVTVADPMHLDGPLAWCAWLAARDTGVILPPMSHEQVTDFHLPLATWTRPAPSGTHPRVLGAGGLAWGWACSRAVWSHDRSTAVEVRKRPPAAEFARWTPDRRHHDALGAHKARNVAYPARVSSRIQWWCLGDRVGVEQLLARLRSLGRVTRHGNGRIARVTVEAGGAADREAWQDRDFPARTGPVGGIRAPYWHVTRQMPLAAGPAPC